MSMIDDFKKYQDEHGLTAIDTNGVKGVSTQNGVLFSVEYLICLLGSDMPQEIKDSEIERLRRTFAELEVFPGVTVRRPGDSEYDSMDNVGAMAAFSGAWDGGAFAQRCLTHGELTRAQGIDLTQDKEMNQKFYKLAYVLSAFREPRFFWNCSNPTLFCFRGWHGRSPGHVAFLRLASGNKVGLLGLLSVLVGQFAGCFKSTDNTDARKLPYVNWQYLKTKGLLWAALYKLWCYILCKQYPDGMRSVYEIYYKDPQHPLRLHSKKFEP